jgi:hypothetical protein
MQENFLEKTWRSTQDVPTFQELLSMALLTDSTLSIVICSKVWDGDHLLLHRPVFLAEVHLRVDLQRADLHLGPRPHQFPKTFLLRPGRSCEPINTDSLIDQHSLLASCKNMYVPPSTHDHSEEFQLRPNDNSQSHIDEAEPKQLNARKEQGMGQMQLIRH